MHRDHKEQVFLFQGPKMTGILLSLFLAAPVLLVSGGLVSIRDQDHNGTIPLVLWHGMGE